jgi:predicted nicotinamide N-methyase
MLRDKSRMTSYHRAIMGNPQDFKDKVVLDVGCGTSVLSCWCARAGARRGALATIFIVCSCAHGLKLDGLMVAVYAVEASSMAEQAQLVVDRNGLSDIVQVINAKMEEITLPEQVDIIVSEVCIDSSSHTHMRRAHTRTHAHVHALTQSGRGSGWDRSLCSSRCSRLCSMPGTAGSRRCATASLHKSKGCFAQATTAG